MIKKKNMKKVPNNVDCDKKRKRQRERKELSKITTIIKGMKWHEIV